MAGNTRTDARTFVLGLDGVPWNLIEKWTAAGKLPNFERLIDEGASGPLESTVPATTPLAWPSIATGVSADKHGIYGWRQLTDDYGHQMYTGDDVTLPYLWDMLSPAVVANVPMTYPAKEIDGSMVTGLMTPEIGDGFTHPPELRREVEDRISDYQIGLYWGEYDGGTPEFRSDLQSLVEARRELMRLLMERQEWRLFFFVYTAPDRLQHLVWDEEVLLDHYQYLDGVLGEVMAYVEDHGASLYVVSDHGFGPVEKHVAVNSVLAEEGWLQRREGTGVRGTFSEFGINRETVLNLLGRVGVDEDAIVDYLPRSIVDRVAAQIPGDNVLYDVDFAGTTAFVHGPGNLYVNDAARFDRGTVDPADVNDVKRKIAQRLSSVTDPETGEPVLEVDDGDDLFPTDPESPDLIVEGRDGYEVVNTFADGEPVAEVGAMAASHRSEGIFLAWGPNVQAGATPSDATVYDVAPTILHDAGKPVPAGADGEVLTDIFEPRSAPATEQVRTREYGSGDGGDGVDDDFDDVEERLRGLGYME